jgi:hypothetical protein
MRMRVGGGGGGYPEAAAMQQIFEKLYGISQMGWKTHRAPVQKKAQA